MLCQECSKRSKCTKLCGAAEEFANQDHVGQDDAIVYVDPTVLDYISGDLNYSEVVNSTLMMEDWEPLRKYMVDLTRLQELCFCKYFFEGFTQEQIAEILGIYQSTVLRHLREAVKKVCIKIPNR